MKAARDRAALTGEQQAQARAAIKRRPELEGADRVDRRAVFSALKWGSRANKDLPPYHRGIIKEDYSTPK